MQDTFKFKLHEDAWMYPEDPATIFSATRYGDRYAVSWNVDGDSGSVDYSVTRVQELLDKGTWILVD